MKIEIVGPKVWTKLEINNIKNELVNDAEIVKYK
jgi:hypothetical protein